MRKTEKELIIDQRIALHQIESYVKTNQLDVIGEFFPGLLHFNRKNDLHILYMNPRGLDKVDLPLSYIQENGAEFFSTFIHKESVEIVFPRFISFYNRNDSGRTYADCQEVLDPHSRKFYQVLTVTKVVKEMDGLMSMSLPVHELGPNMRKINLLMETDTYYESYFQKFNRLPIVKGKS